MEVSDTAADRTDGGRRMVDAAGRGGDDVDGAHHAGRKLVEDGLFEARDGAEAWMVGCSRCKVDAGAPGLVERVSRRIDHTWESLDTFQLVQRRRGQDRLDGRAQAFVVNGPREPAGKPYGPRLKRHDLQAVTTCAGRREAAFPHGETTMNDQGGSTRGGPGRSPSGRYCLFGR